MKKLFLFLISLAFISSCEDDKVVTEALEAKITYPSGGEVFIRGGLLTIEWSDDISNEVRIRLYKGNNRVLNISDSLNNSGKYSWIIPANISDGKDYSLKIYSNDNDFLSYKCKEFKILGKNGDSTYTDLRDNQTYKIVKIGRQWWFAENFNYQTTSGSWPSESGYGRFYDFQAAQSACPNGWQLPSDSDWKNLEEFVGIKVSELNSSGARGRNEGFLLYEYGGLEFDIKFSGYHDFYSNNIYNSFMEANFWTSSKYYGQSAWIRRFFSTNGSITRTSMPLNQGLSVRYCKYDE